MERTRTPHVPPLLWALLPREWQQEAGLGLGFGV